MKIIMLSTVPGSVDGFRVTTYQADVEYDLGATDGERALAHAFVDAGLAEESGAAMTSAAAEAVTEADATAEPAEGAPAKPGRKAKAA